MSTKECLGFFLFCLDLEFFIKIKKDLVSTHRKQVYQKLKIKKNLKNPEHPFLDISK